MQVENIERIEGQLPDLNDFMEIVIRHFERETGKGEQDLQLCGVPLSQWREHAQLAERAIDVVRRI